MSLHIKILKNVFADAFISFSGLLAFQGSQIIQHIYFLQNTAKLSPDLQAYIATVNIINSFITLCFAFIIFIFAIFIKHTKGVTADYSKYIWDSILERNRISN